MCGGVGEGGERLPLDSACGLGVPMTGGLFSMEQANRAELLPSSGSGFVDGSGQTD